MLLSLHFGRHFWLDDDNELMSCPSFVDGNPDTFNEDYVSEWDDFSDVDVRFVINKKTKVKDLMTKKVITITKNQSTAMSSFGLAKTLLLKSSVAVSLPCDIFVDVKRISR